MIGGVGGWISFSKMTENVNKERIPALLSVVTQCKSEDIKCLQKIKLEPKYEVDSIYILTKIIKTGPSTVNIRYVNPEDHQIYESDTHQFPEGWKENKIGPEDLKKKW